MNYILNNMERLDKMPFTDKNPVFIDLMDMASYQGLTEEEQWAAYSGDTRSPIPVISVHSVGNLQYRRQS
jgi:hypothetical protein